MRHKKHLFAYMILVAIILYYVYSIVISKGNAYHSTAPTSGTDGTGNSLGHETTPDLRQGTTQGSLNKLYSVFNRRRLGVTAF